MITVVADASQVAEARRLASARARSLGLPEAKVAEVAIVTTELATNLLKHGDGGSIQAVAWADQDGAGLEIKASDRGDGMTDVARCIADGYSTAGSAGNGLGAVMRLADIVRIYSRPALGTVIMARFIQREPNPGSRTWVGSAVAIYPGEEVCGDAWAWSDSPDGCTVIMVDGAGHGSEAAKAAAAATQTFLAQPNQPCEAMMDTIHRAMAPTRGGAVAIARIDARARMIRYVGVGNITGVLITDQGARHLVSHNGTAGHVAPRIREFTYEFQGAPLLILHSDGLGGRWDLASYPGLLRQHPSLIAGVLLRDHRRGRDDASVVALQAQV